MSLSLALKKSTKYQMTAVLVAILAVISGKANAFQIGSVQKLEPGQSVLLKVSQNRRQSQTEFIIRKKQKAQHRRGHHDVRRTRKVERWKHRRRHHQRYRSRHHQRYRSRHHKRYRSRIRLHFEFNNRKPYYRERERRRYDRRRARRRLLPAPIPIQDKRYRKKQIIITLRGRNARTLHRAIARQYNLRLIRGRYYPLLRARVQLYRIPDRRTVGVVMAQLKRDRRVKEFYPNRIYKLTGAGKSQSGGLQYSHSSMRIKKAQQLALGRKIKVAVIDTGVDIRHPEFRKAKITQYNAVQPRRKYKGHKHGTAIAGIIAAQNDVRGVAPGAHILDARAFFISRKTGQPETDSMILVDALNWAYERGAKVFNLSFEGPKDPLFEDSLQAIYEKGRVIVGAAGNGGPKAKPAFPAAYKFVIATTAIDKENQVYDRANRGRYLALAAPGVKVMVLSTSDSYSFESGTSIATAHVTGLVALMLEAKPKMSVQEIRKVLMNTAKDLGKPGADEDYGAGLVDAYSSLQALQKVSLSKN